MYACAKCMKKSQQKTPTAYKTLVYKSLNDFIKHVPACTITIIESETVKGKTGVINDTIKITNNQFLILLWKCRASLILQKTILFCASFVNPNQIVGCKSFMMSWRQSKDLIC